MSTTPLPLSPADLERIKAYCQPGAGDVEFEISVHTDLPLLLAHVAELTRQVERWKAEYEYAYHRMQLHGDLTWCKYCDEYFDKVRTHREATSPKAPETATAPSKADSPTPTA